MPMIYFYNQQQQIRLKPHSTRFLGSILSLVYCHFQVTLHVSFRSAVALQKCINPASIFKLHAFIIVFLNKGANKKSAIE